MLQIDLILLIMNHQRVVFTLYLLVMASSQLSNPSIQTTEQSSKTTLLDTFNVPSNTTANVTLLLTPNTSLNSSDKKQEDRTMSNWAIAGIILVLIVGAVCLICWIIYIIENRQRQIKKKKQAIELRNLQQRFNAKYRSLTVREILDNQYQQQREIFINLMYEVKIRTKVFTECNITSKGTFDNEIIFDSISTIDRDDFEVQIKVQGSDYTHKSWEGSGGFILTSDGPFFWLTKYYKNKEGLKKMRIFESRVINAEGANGLWFDEDWQSKYRSIWQIGAINLRSQIKK